jgi:Berberine and berberine like
MAWARRLFEALKPQLQDGAYVNNLGAEGVDRVRAAYGPNMPRLAEIKRTYDPDNVFRMNQNIQPQARAGR